MSLPTNRFQQLIARTRDDDQQAAEELMRLYEPHVRRAIRFRMRNRALRQFVDSIDISQSVMTNFFVRLKSGDLETETPEQLISLLVRMARNRVIDWVRKSQTLRSDCRRQTILTDIHVEQISLRDRSSSAESQVDGAELMDEVRRRLNSTDRRLLDQRSQDVPWQTIACEENRSAEALRIQLRRSLQRVAVDLGLLEST